MESHGRSCSTGLSWLDSLLSDAYRLRLLLLRQSPGEVPVFSLCLNYHFHGLDLIQFSEQVPATGVIDSRGLLIQLPVGCKWLQRLQRRSRWRGNRFENLSSPFFVIMLGHGSLSLRIELILIIMLCFRRQDCEGVKFRRGELPPSKSLLAPKRFYSFKLSWGSRSRYRRLSGHLPSLWLLIPWLSCKHLQIQVALHKSPFFLPLYLFSFRSFARWCI